MGFSTAEIALIKLVQNGSYMRAGVDMVKTLSGFGLKVSTGASGQVPGYVREAIKSDLIHLKGFDESIFESGAEIPEGDGSRAAELKVKFDEKSGSKPVYQDRIFVRPQKGRSIYFEDQSCHIPDGAILSIDTKTANKIIAMGFILVENEESFYEFHKLNFEVPDELKSHPVLFRGKPHVARQDTCEDFLTSFGVPVTVYPDFDPSGLANALSVPLFDDILWPGQAALQLALDERGSRELFDRQMAGARGRMLRGARGNLQTAWAMINAVAKGLNQEHFHQQD